jgi:hypothetical protein
MLEVPDATSSMQRNLSERMEIHIYHRHQGNVKLYWIEHGSSRSKCAACIAVHKKKGAL